MCSFHIIVACVAAKAAPQVTCDFLRAKHQAGRLELHPAFHDSQLKNPKTVVHFGKNAKLYPAQTADSSEFCVFTFRRIVILDDLI